MYEGDQSQRLVDSQRTRMSERISFFEIAKCNKINVIKRLFYDFRYAKSELTSLSLLESMPCADKY